MTPNLQVMFRYAREALIDIATVVIFFVLLAFPQLIPKPKKAVP